MIKPPSRKDVDLRYLLAVYRRRRRIIQGIIVAILGTAVAYCVWCTRRYQAVGTIQIQKEGADAMGLGSLMANDSDTTGGLDTDINLETQASILQSDTLALRAIEDLNLENTPDFKPTHSALGWLERWISPSSPPDPTDTSLENAPARRARALRIFRRNLKVKPVVGTRLIEIDYLNPSPRLAAQVVNKLIQALSDYSFQTRYTATTEASEWLSGQLGDLRKQAEDLQAKVEALQQQSGVYSFGSFNADGAAQTYSGVLDRLQQATTALGQAEQNRIVRGAIWKAAEKGDAEMLSSLAGNTMIGSSGGGGSAGALSAVVALRQQEEAQKTALREAEVKYGRAYPKIAEMRAGIAGTQQSIQEEVGILRDRARTDYAIAIQTETELRQEYARDKKDADKLNNKAIEYTIIRQEADDSREIYEDLLKRLKEAGVLEGLRSSDVIVVDPGRVPASPKVPNVPVYLALALGIGLFVSACAALVLENLDNKIHDVTDLEELLGQRVLGATPLFDIPQVGPGSQQNSLIALREPRSTFTEVIRAIRTAVLLARSDRAPKVILITSSIAGEGKTVVGSNLAVILAQRGQRVLLVDSDMRRGALRERMNLPKNPGLSALLAGQIAEPPLQVVPGNENLHVITAGMAAPNPVELLESDTMLRWLNEWREQYDFVVLDGTPILPVTDAIILNALADVTLLIVRSKYTHRPQAVRSYTLLTQQSRHYVGVILNGLDAKDDTYYNYYGYYGYKSVAYGGEEE